jgi:4-hydroxy-tetrahydrodipicolinate reductase
MGTAVQAAITEASGVELGAAVDQGDDLEALSGELDVVIDFTVPEASLAHVRTAAEKGVAAVVGTTGFTDAQKAELAELATRIPVVFAPNMSVGVNVLVSLVERAVRMLGAEFDSEIAEIHHRQKKDSPSGTALRLAEAVAQARGVELADHARYERHGLIGARPAGEIGVQTLRGGDVVGEHTVYLFGLGERIELSHRATDRMIFARGAVRAARWVKGRPPGLYTMADVLG